MQQVVGLNHQRDKSLLEWVKAGTQTFIHLTSELTLLMDGLHLRLSPTQLTLVTFGNLPERVIDGELKIYHLPPLQLHVRCPLLVFQGLDFTYTLKGFGCDAEDDELEMTHEMIDDARQCMHRIASTSISQEQTRHFREVLAAAKAKFA